MCVQHQSTAFNPFLNDKKMVTSMVSVNNAWNYELSHWFEETLSSGCVGLGMLTQQVIAGQYTWLI